jgi:hypothetical protein
VRLCQEDRDEIRRVVTERLQGIKPPIPPTSCIIDFHRVIDEGSSSSDLYVIEMRVPQVITKDLFFTIRDEAYVKTDGGKRRLNGPQIQQEILKRFRLE